MRVMNKILHIYTRVSSYLQQEEGTSLENQKQLGIRKAEELGVDYKLWNEGGQSSFHDDLNNRPALVALLAQIESGVIKHVFVYNADRLSRNQQTWAVIRFKLLKFGVTLHTVSGQMTLKNPVDDLLLGILSEISQYDNRIRSERARLGRFSKVKQGNSKGGPPPFGYHLEGRKLAIDDFESKWVKQIFDWYCLGVSSKDIQGKLQANGVITRRGHTQWSLGSIRLILKNSVYAGHYDYMDKMVGQTVRIVSPAIIHAQMYQLAQDMRATNKRIKHQTNPTKHFYLLSEVIVCGHCGMRMGGRINKAGHQNVYYCVKTERTWKTRNEDRPKWQRGTSCSMVRSINIDKTDAHVWNVVMSAVENMSRVLPLDSLNKSTAMTTQANEMDARSHDFTQKNDGLNQDAPNFVDAAYEIEANITKQLLSESSMQTSIDESFIELIDLVLKPRNDSKPLTAEQKKVCISKVVKQVCVFYDKQANQHRLEVELTTTASQTLRSLSGNVADLEGSLGIFAGALQPKGTVKELLKENPSVKKSGGSRVVSAAKQDYSVTVE